jgi:hypothetical protein
VVVFTTGFWVVVALVVEDTKDVEVPVVIIVVCSTILAVVLVGSPRASADVVITFTLVENAAVAPVLVEVTR